MDSQWNGCGSEFSLMLHNVPIIAAVADLKAQIFHFKTKVYE